MKILKNIFLPLLILLAVVGLFGAGWLWGVTHAQVFSGMERREAGEFRRPAPDGENRQFQPRPAGLEAHPFGGSKRGPSLLRGLGEAIASLFKLAVIVVLVLLVQRGLAWFDAWRANRKTPPAAPPAEPAG